MDTYLFKMQNSFVLLLSIFVMSAILCFLVTTDTVSADNRGPWNQPEQNAYNLCWWGPGTQYGPRGAIWFTNGGYYDANVYLDHQQSNVTVAIRGSVYGCGRGSPGPIYAVNVRPDGANAGLLTGLSSSTLYRGALPNPASRNWSSQGGDIYANLNVGWIPPNNSASPQTHNFQVGLYRCFHQNGANGSCYTEMINVTVVRAGRPIQWDFALRSEISGVASRRGNTPGQELAFQHRIRNWGPDATDRSINFGTRMVRVNMPANGAMPQKEQFVLSSPTNRVDSVLYGAAADRQFGVGTPAQPGTSDPLNLAAFWGDVYVNEGGWQRNYQMQRRITQDDVGKWICGYMYVQHAAWNQINVPRFTDGACQAIPYNYNLYPAISSSADVVSVGEKIELDTRVLNDGSTKSNGDSSTSIYEYVIPADRADEVSDFKALFNQRATNVGPGNLTVDYRQYRSTAPDLVDGCERIAGGSFGDIPCTRVHGQGVIVPDGNGAGYSRQVSTESRHTTGSVVCYVLLINNLSQNVDRQEKRASAPSCVSVGKRPSMQVLGGDVRVRGEIRTSIKTIDPEFMDVTAYDGNSTFGSWTEFGTMSAYRNQAMASAEGLRRGSTSSTQSGWSDLTFANILPDELDPEEDTYQYGFFEGLPSPSRIAEYFAGKESTSVSGSVNVAGRNGVYAPTGTINLSGTANGSVVIYAPDETVNITDNITLDDTTIGSLSDLAQVVIIARNITIASDVNRVDAWLIASDHISTCAGRNLEAPALTVTSCSQPLTVTGPVATSELYLFRTAGSEYDEAIRDPAEIFNLRPDAYLWALSYADDRGYPETAAVSELPPRY